MAGVALSAVLISTSSAFPVDELPKVEGPSSRDDLQTVPTTLNHYARIGYQASHLAQAMEICEKMLKPQVPSKAPEPLNGSKDAAAIAEAAAESTENLGASLVYVQPTIFLGATANLFGTGCREAIRFLCAECVPLPDGVQPAAPPDEILSVGVDETVPSCSSRAIIHALVVSGGAMEHDIRRACEPYRIIAYGSESAECPHEAKETMEGRFGNIAYGTRPDPDNRATPNLFCTVMQLLVARVISLQQHRRAEAMGKHVPEKYDDVCSWSFAPSSVWLLAGRWLPEIFAEALRCVYLNNSPGDVKIAQEAQQRAESTVLYWAARHEVPIFSPSFADGDIMDFIIDASAHSPMLKVDLVADIHRINKLAMRSRRTGMIILGGGVVKHHVCNANLMRNGADFTVIVNNGQEYDGSDAGARPDEAVSWGKIRLDGEYVKVYAEVSLVLPLLVAHVFLPYIRKARRKNEMADEC